MRLFIAVELPKPFKAELIRLQKELKAVSAGGRFVPEDSFHITLHFLGETEDIVSIAKAMGEAVRGMRPFALHLSKLGCFDKNDGKTPYIEVAGDIDELNVLYDSLESALTDAGFPKERKRFTPHITLGRGVKLDDVAEHELGAQLPDASLSVNGITLFESRREKNGMVYYPLHRERF